MKKAETELIARDEELMKALAEILDPDELKNFLKAEDEEGDEEEKEEEEEEEEDESEEKEEEQKAKKKAKTDEMKKEGFEKAIDVFSKINIENNKKIDARFEKIETMLAKIGGQSAGLKSKTIFEKSETDDNGNKDERKVLSISKNKGELLKAIEDICDKTKESFMKSHYESSIIALNMGNAPVSKEVATDLFKNHNIRVVK